MKKKDRHPTCSRPVSASKDRRMIRQPFGEELVFLSDKKGLWHSQESVSSYKLDKSKNSTVNGKRE